MAAFETTSALFYDLSTNGDVESSLRKLTKIIPDQIFGFQAQCLQSNTYHHLSAYNADPDIHDDFEHVRDNNPVTPFCMSAPLDTVFESRRYLPPNRFEKTEFYNEFWRPRNVGPQGCLGLVVHRKNMDAAMFMMTVAKGTSEARLTELRRLLAELRQPFQTAFDFFLRTGARADTIELSSFFLEQFSTAALVVDKNLRLRALNGLADKALVEGAALKIDCNGNIAAQMPEDQKRLAEAVAIALSNCKPCGPLTIRQTGQFNCLAYVAPLPTRESLPDFALPFIEREELVLIKILRPGGLAAGDAGERLRLVFQLSAREAQIVEMLAAGSMPKAIAEQVGVSYHTVRNHIASILQKTGTRSQIELVSLVTGLIEQ